MRKVILTLAVSLDNYIARENGDVDWLKMEDLSEAADEMNDFFSSIDTILFGRKTYEKGVEMAEGDDIAAVGGIMNYVFTREPRQSTRKDVVFISKDPKGFIENLKTNPGKNIYLMGGGDLAKTLLTEGLVDEIVLGIQPIILGKGIPLFLPHERQTDLQLIKVQTRQSGTVQVTYHVKK